MTNTVAVFNASGALTGAFTTIQAAVAAASAGSRLVLSAGTFNESVIVDKALRFEGAGSGSTVVTGLSGDGFLLTGDLGTTATVEIEGIAFTGSASGSGVRFADGAILGTLSITDSHFANNFRNGVQIGGGSSPIDLDNVIIADTDFVANGGNPTAQTSSGDGDILFFNYNGDATISNVNITGAVVGSGPAENAIQFRSDAGSLGDVTLSDVTISGVYEKQPLAFFNYDDIAGLSATNVVVTADSTSFQLAANFDGIGGNFDFSALGIDVSGAPDVVALQGDATSQTITSGAENALLRGAGGNDTLNGGEGTDTASYRGDLATFTIATSVDENGAVTILSVTDNNAAADTDEGTDTLSGVENLLFKGNVLLSTSANAFVFDGNNLLGTFSTIQAAIDAAGTGNTVMIAAGTFAEQLVINKDITLTGQGAATIITAPAGTIDAVNNGAGSRAAIITVTGGATATITELSVDGEGRGDQLEAGASDFHGIAFISAGGSVDDVTVTGIRMPLDGNGQVSGVQQGRAIFANNADGAARTLSVTDSTVTDFQKNGIDLRGTGLTVTVSGNDVTGNGATPTTAQNGIVILGPAGTVTGNTVSEVGYVLTGTNSPATSAGILSFNSSGVTIDGNTLNGPTNAVSLPNTLSAAGVSSFNDTDGIVVTNNTITGFSIGVFSDDDGAAPTLSGNVFTDNTLNLSISGVTAPANMVGTDGDDNLTGSTGNDTASGLGGNDVINGAGGNDTLTGGAGDDTIDGGADVDTVSYTGAVTATSITNTGSAWSVDAGTEGTDSLTNVEFVTGTAGRTLLVGNGGFATIQAAVDAANAGDTILVAAGDYAETVTVDTQLFITGANAGIAGSGERSTESTITGGIHLVAGSAGTVIDGLAIAEGATMAGELAGVFVQADNVTITNSLITRSGDFDASRGIVTATGDAQGLFVIFNSIAGFATGAFINPGSDATILSNTFEANNVGLSNDGPDATAIIGNSFVDNVFEQIGLGATNSPTDASAIIGANNFSGSAPEVSIYPLAGVDGQTITGTIHDDVFNGDQTDTAFAQTFNGLDGDDILNGAGGNDTLNGGEGDDQINGGADNDTLDGGAGTDSLDGGAGGIDTAIYSDAATVAWNGSAWVVTSAADGTESLNDIEIVNFEGIGGARTLLVDATATGGFSTIQAAVNAASAGDTILVADGTYTETVTISTANLTILGANAASSAHDGTGLNGDRGAESTLVGTFVLNADGAHIAGFEITGAADAVRVQTGGQSLDNITIVNNYIHDTTDSPIRAGLGFGGGIDSENWSLSGNLIEAINGNARTALVLFNIDGLDVSDNIINHDVGSSTGRRGFNLDGVRNATISGNTINMGLVAPTDATAASAAAPFGIQISMSDRSVENLQITDNTISGASSGVVGLSQRDLVNALISGNTITDVISGVVLNGGSTPPQETGVTMDVNVTDNTISAATNAVFVRDLHDGHPNGPITFVNLDVTGNTVTQGVVQIGRAETFVAAGATGPGNGLLNVSGPTTIEGSANNDVVQVEGASSVTFAGANGNDAFIGGAGDDSVSGGAGSDTLDGGAGTDSLDGGADDDVYFINDATDIVVEAADGGNDTVTARVNYTLSEGAEVETLAAVGGTGPIDLNGNAFAQTLLGNDGANTLSGAGGDDTIDGGADVDTVSYTGAVTATSITNTGSAWSVDAGTEGTDTLTNVEFVTGTAGRTLLVGNGGFATIQAAVDAANAGDTILIAAGTYAEDVTINKQVSVIGDGASTVIEGGVDISASGADADNRVVLKDVTVRNAAGDAIDVGEHSFITISGVTVEGLSGSSDAIDINFAGAAEDIVIEGSNFELSGGQIGVRVADVASVTGLKILDSTFVGGQYGLYFANDTAGSGDTLTGEFRGLTFSGQTNVGGDGFRGFAIYAEKASNATFADIEVNAPETGSNLAIRGINLNLKNGAFENVALSGITLNGFDAVQSLTSYNPLLVVGVNSGASLDGLTLDAIEGIKSASATGNGAIVLDIFHAAFPGQISDVSLTNSILTGLVKIQTSEYTSVTNNQITGDLEFTLVDPPVAPGSDLSGNTVTGEVRFIDGRDAELPEGADNLTLFNGTLIGGVDNNQSGTGNSGNNVITGNDGANALSGLGGDDTLNAGQGDDDLDGGQGNDVINGAGGNDTLTGGAGDDTIDGGADVDTVSYTGAVTATSITNTGSAWSVDAGTEGTDTLTNVEFVTGTAGRTLLVGNGGFATIQAAVDAASAGDTILIAAGDYAETVTVDTQLFITGANAGIAGSGERSTESTITGGIHLVAGSAGTVIDGLAIAEGATMAGELAGVFVQADNVTITNSLITRGGDFDASRGIVTATGDAQGLFVIFNTIAGFATGAFINPGSDATILSNTFEANNVGLSNDGPDATAIIGNSFVDNVFEQIGLGATNSPTDASAIIGANNFSGTAPEVSIYPLAGVDGQTITGTIHDDVFNGDQTDTAFAQTFNGLDGDDILNGAGGNDTLNGGEGNDQINGGAGIDTAGFGDAISGMLIDLGAGLTRNGGTLLANGTYSGGTVEDTLTSIENAVGTSFGDRLVSNIAGSVLNGAGGNDRIVSFGDGAVLQGDAGLDTVEGGNGADDIAGGSGDDSLLGNGGDDTIDGGDDNDFARGGEGADLISGGAGVDRLEGDADNDTLIGGAGADTLVGGAGIDFASYATAAAAVQVRRDGAAGAGDAAGDVIVEIEGVIGSDFADLIVDDANGGILNGGAGNDTIFGNAGDDTATGGAGADRINLESGNDLALLGGGGDTVDGGTGSDTASYVNATAAVAAGLNGSTGGGNAAGDQLSGFERLIGSAFNDTLRGGNGVDTLDGGEGNDTLDGNGGNDNLSGANGDDRIDGGSGNDTLLGGAGADRLLGVAGLDRLEGGEGNDTLIGGAGADSLIGGAGIDFASYETATSAVQVRRDGAASTGDALGDIIVEIEGVIGSRFNDLIVDDANANFIDGGAGNDILFGNAGSDTVAGGTGADLLNLEGGDDVALLGNGDNAIGDTVNGGTGIDTADYSAAVAAISVGLNGFVGTGAAAGDRFSSVERVIGSAFNDTIRGGNFGDTLTGGGGNDILDGNGGADSLVGGIGADRIDAGSGTDTLVGGEGNDTLIGGADADRAVMEANGGADIFADFTNGSDLVDVAALGTAFDTFAEISAAATQVGSNVLIDFGTTSITLNGLSLASLDASDFVFGA